MRQTRKRTAQNRAQRSRLRTAVRAARAAAAPEEGDAARRIAEQLLDRASRKRLIHPNKAARLKSRLKAGK
jgi:small subunit ribosomal protein S20